jgi:hypothetical protein
LAGGCDNVLSKRYGGCIEEELGFPRRYSQRNGWQAVARGIGWVAAAAERRRRAINARET